MCNFYLKFALMENSAVARLLCWKAFAVCLYNCTPSAVEQVFVRQQPASLETRQGEDKASLSF
jgi:hypothetical protein